MKIRLLLLASLCLSGCVITPHDRGETTTAMRGAQRLATKGDPLMPTGVYSGRDVSPDWAAGYQAGLTDAVKREYWDIQEGRICR
jgi:hypothetical protein